MLDPAYAKHFENLTPVKELSGTGLALLKEKAQLANLGPGKTLSASEQTRWYLYLLEGQLKIWSNGEAPQMVAPNSARANEPLFGEHATHATASTQSACRFIRFERQLFDTLLNEERLAGYEVVDVQVNDAESELFQQIYHASHNNQLELPTMPDVALKIVKLAEDPEVGIPEITKIVQLEPSVAGSIIKAANSSLYGGSKPVDNIKRAVLRLGLKSTCNVATSIALRQTFKTKSALLKQRMQQLWKHSVNVSALSYVIAQRVQGLDPERALMAGLLHDIGGVPILNYVEANKLDPSADDLETTIEKLRGMIGVLVLKYWGLDSDLATVVEESNDWQRDPNPEADYCDVVLVAQLYDHSNSTRSGSLPCVHEVPAYGKLNLGETSEAANAQILEDAAEEIASIKQILAG